MSEQEPFFSIEKVYVKDMSLEVPHTPEIFTERETPTIDIKLHNEGRVVNGALYEVVLTATVTAKVKEKTAFLVEVAQAGVFQLQNYQQQQLDAMVNVTCAKVLLPYARETVSTVLSRAGFPPVLLPHVGFENIYLQRQQEQLQPQASAAPASQAADG